MAGWSAGVTAIVVRALVPGNDTCLRYWALVNSTTPIRGNGIAKTQLSVYMASCTRNVYCYNKGKNNIYYIIKFKLVV